MNITIRQLKVFVAAYQTRSFTLAGERMHMTQSAVSKICRELEDALEFQLFERSARTLIPVDGAAELYALALEILASVDVAERSVRSLKSLDRGRVHIAASPLIMASLVAPAIQAFHGENPAVHLELYELTTDEGIDHILSGKVDVALVSMGDDHPKLQRREVYRSSMWVACPANHALAGRGSVTLSALAEYPHLGLREGYGFARVVKQALEEADLSFNSVIGGGSLMSSLALCRHGAGVALIPGYVASLARSLGLAVVPIEGDAIAHKLYLVSRVNTRLSLAAARFLTIAESTILALPRDAEDVIGIRA
jgi:DNA-binding transcriptional LysR family regulator